jgi:ketosteroid isomerase-like protein
MRPHFVIPALAAITVAAGCQPQPAALSSADIAAIRASEEAFTQNGRTRKDSANAALYSENAVLMPPHEPALTGRPAIRRWLAAFPPMSDFGLTVVEIDGRGDLAYVRGTYALTIAASGKTPALPDHGKYVEVRRKQADGSWLIVLDIFNSDLPAPK